MAPSVLTYTTGATYHLCRGLCVPFDFKRAFYHPQHSIPCKNGKFKGFVTTYW